jgi:peptidoglycan-associated lipoprotein
MATVSPAPARPAIETGIIPGTLRDFEVNVGDRVFFSFDKSNLDDAARAALQKQAAWLSRYQAVTVAIQGNADERGTREYNIALGARRATAVKDYLVSLGVRYDRLTTISFGKERPVCVESNEACWSQNRRAVSAITNAAASPNNVAMRN